MKNYFYYNKEMEIGGNKMNNESIIASLKNYIYEVEEDIKELTQQGKYTKIIAFGHLSRIGLLTDLGIISPKKYGIIVNKIRKAVDITEDELIEASFLTTND